MDTWNLVSGGHFEHRARALGVAELNEGHEPGGCCSGVSEYLGPRNHFSFPITGG